MSLNRVFLLGRLGSDPELRYTQNQTAVCTFRMATNERRRGADGEYSDHTEWHTVVSFGKTAENCGQYLQKGRQAFIEGKIQTRKYQDQDGKDRYFTEVLANTVQFIGGRADGMEVERTDAPDSMPMGGGKPQQQAARPKASVPPVNPASIGETISFEDDDIPF